jgi:diguanylate cyclase
MNMNGPAKPAPAEPKASSEADAPPAGPVPDELARASAAAQRALERIKSLGLPPNPINFELWFTYFNGHHKALNRVLEAAGELTPATLRRVYDDHLSPDRFIARMHTVGDGLRGQASSIVGLLEQAAETNSAYHANLVGVTKSLDPLSDPRTVETVIAGLVRSTNAAMQANAQLHVKLKESETKISNLQTNLELVQQECNADPLTTTFNRAAFDRKFAAMTTRAAQTGEPLWLMLIDVDHFKFFNDRYGHLVGDDVLRLTALTLKQSVRDGDLVARLGGDEFAVALVGVDEPTTMALAERIRQAVRDRQIMRRSTSQPLGRMTVCVGVASYVAGQAPDDLIQRADSNLYAAKRGGRDCVIGPGTERPGESAFP